MPEGRLMGEIFKPIEERYIKHMSDWKEITLSQVAREVLIKFVAQALPTYIMSVFKVPFGICDALEKHTRARRGCRVANAKCSGFHGKSLLSRRIMVA
jgi:hypothetical protein